MATRMRPEDRSRVFGAATDDEGVTEQRHLELNILEDGNIGGLNGLLLAAADEVGLRGSCLLGEMPHIFSQAPFPKASLGILEVFTTITGIDLDLGELADQAKVVEEQLQELLTRVEEQYGHKVNEAPGEAEEDDEEEEGEAEEEEGYQTEAEEEQPRISPSNRAKVEELFRRAASDRSKAFELKRMLDRLGVFKQYEDRFLDLFKKGKPGAG
jgi:vacuolar-type H+-ATPase subunit H